MLAGHKGMSRVQKMAIKEDASMKSRALIMTLVSLDSDLNATSSNTASCTTRARTAEQCLLTKIQARFALPSCFHSSPLAFLIFRSFVDTRDHRFVDIPTAMSVLSWTGMEHTAHRLEHLVNMWSSFGFSS